MDLINITIKAPPEKSEEIHLNNTASAELWASIFGDSETE